MTATGGVVPVLLGATTLVSLLGATATVVLWRRLGRTRAQVAAIVRWITSVPPSPAGVPARPATLIPAPPVGTGVPLATGAPVARAPRSWVRVGPRVIDLRRHPAGGPAAGPAAGPQEPPAGGRGAR